MVNEHKLHGLLLAAGRGRRMGGNKQFHLVPTADSEKPLVAAAFDTIASACEAMFVVVGHRADEVVAALENRNFQVVESDPDAPMINSIKTGLHAALKFSRTVTRSGDNVSILLQLGDHPAVNSKTLTQIVTIASEHPGKAIMPTFNGNGGHPVLIPATIAEQILTADDAGGLRQFWLDHTDICIRFEVDDPGVVHDIDTL
jgi:molybdenum cofactor cytidylyltransferase